MRYFRHPGCVSQSAMEFLLVNGWAIILAVSVGAALWQLGVFSFGSSAYTSSGFSTLLPLLSQGSMSADAYDFEMLFYNGAGRDITLTEALVMHRRDGYPYCWVTAKTNDMNSSVCVTSSKCWACIEGPNGEFQCERDNPNPPPPRLIVSLEKLIDSGDFGCVEDEQDVVVPEGDYVLIHAVDDCDWGVHPPKSETFVLEMVLGYDLRLGGIPASKSSHGRIMGPYS